MKARRSFKSLQSFYVAEHWDCEEEYKEGAFTKEERRVLALDLEVIFSKNSSKK